MFVHWILVGIAIGIGLMLAPMVYELALILMQGLIRVAFVLGVGALVIFVIRNYVPGWFLAFAFVLGGSSFLILMLNEVIWHWRTVPITWWWGLVLMLPTLPFFIAHVIVAPLYPDDPDWALVYWGVASLGVIVCYVLLAAVYERWRADQIRRNGTATVEKDLREPS